MQRLFFAKQRGPFLRLSLLILVLISATIVSVEADGPNQAGLVIIHGDGAVVTHCIEFAENEITGLELLEQSSLDLNMELGGLMGSTICGLDGEGCAYPIENCFCQCQGSPCVFWQYWQRQDDGWSFSQLGAANYTVSHGDVQGWVWAEGSPSGNGIAPPIIPFEQICPLPATSTPAPSPEVSLPASATPTMQQVASLLSATVTPRPTTRPTATLLLVDQTVPAIPVETAEPQSIWPTLLSGFGLIFGLTIGLGLVVLGGVQFFRRH